MSSLRLSLVSVVLLSLAGCGYSARPLSGSAVLAELRETRTAPAPAAAEPAAAPAAVDGAAALGEEEAVAIALAWSPTVRAGEGRVSVAEAEVDAAGAWPASELRLNDFGFREGRDQIDDFEVAFRLHLPNPWAHAAAVDAREAGVPAERAEQDQVAWDVRHDVRLTWVEAVAGRRRVALTAALNEAAQAIVAQARVAAEQGGRDPLEVLAFEVDALNAEERHEEAMADAQRSTRALLRRLGRPDATALALPTDDDALRCPSPVSDVAALEERIAAAHPSVRRLEAEYTAAEAFLEAAHDEQIPFLEYIQFGYGYDARQRESGFSVSLSFELPFGAWSGGDVAVAEAQRSFVAAELRSVVTAQADAARAAVVRWRDAATKVRWFAERVEPTLLAAEQRAEEALEAGTATAEKPLAARRELLEMRLAALEARYRCHVAWIDAEHAAGVPIPE